MFDLQNHDGVFVLRMTNGENRVNPGFIDGFNKALDEVEKSNAHALVTTGEGKFYSNGLDLDWMGSAGAEANKQHVARLEALYSRVLTLPMITVCALNGHGFAAGAMLALAHDYRVMRSDRGYFCLPEVDIRIPFTPLMSALIVARLPKLTAHEAMVTGRRYTADESKAGGIVHEIASEAEVLSASIELARKYGGKPGDTLGAIKREAYKSVSELAS